MAFNAASYSIGEGGSSATITVILSASSASTITVDYATSNGTATAGIDYTAVGSTLTFAPGQVSRTFSVPIADDAYYESSETITLTLSNPVNATLGAQSTATLTITDNESGGPNIGPPDGGIATITPGSPITIDLGGTPIVADGNPDPVEWDLVYYERVNGLSRIQLDFVVVEISQAPGGPWYTVFYWGNAITDTNTIIGGSYPPPEANNQIIPFADLWNGPGIAIDVDALVPVGIYPYVRISDPGGSPDPTEVDAIQIL